MAQDIFKMDTYTGQTAVEWLVEQINGKSLNKVIIDIPKEIIEQAKEMEKEQIEEAIDKVLMSYGIIKLKSNGTRYF